MLSHGSGTTVLFFYRPKTASPTTKMTLICGLSFRIGLSVGMWLFGVCRFNERSQPAGHQQSPLLQPFWQDMRKLGWMEGQNIVMEARWADMQFERLPALATELVQVPVDLIVAEASVETEAAKQATSTIPIVMAHS
jgi:hypothetical protein